MRYAGTTVLLVLAGAMQSPAQPGLGPDGPDCSLSVRADVDSAAVVLNGKMRGRTPLLIEGLTPGLWQIRVLHPDIESWYAQVVEDSVRLLPGERRDIEVRLDRRLLIRSNPSGAEVRQGNRILGTTPLVFEPLPEDSVLRIIKPGFDTTTANLSYAQQGVLTVPMTLSPDGGVVPDLLLTDRREPSVLPLVLSGVSALVAGGFSAHEKMKADEAYNTYLANGDPVKRGEARKLDSVAAISLAASQIYMMLFTYLLLSP